MVTKSFSYELAGIKGIENLPVSVFEKLKEWNIETEVSNGKVTAIHATAVNTMVALKKLKMANAKLWVASNKF